MNLRNKKGAGSEDSLEKLGERTKIEVKKYSPSEIL
jgi:hypothetical protein